MSTKPIESDYNASDISYDLVCVYLKDGRRTPQNKDEEELLAEIEAIEKRGNGMEVYFD